MNVPFNATGGSLNSSMEARSEEDLDLEIRRLEDRVAELSKGNEDLHDKISDLRQIMHHVDESYDRDVSGLTKKNEELQLQVKALESALKVSEKHSAHFQ